MAELPEVWGSRLPAQRPLYDCPSPTFGVAREAERMRQGIPPPSIRRGPSRTTGRLGNHDSPVGRRAWNAWSNRGWWWSGRENGPLDWWHRVMCRRDRHEFGGGYTMQLGNETVYVERRCVWCDSGPPGL